jgi:antagonist of KipI
VGGCKGRALKKGDVISFRQSNFTTSSLFVFPWSVSTAFYNQPEIIHCIKGVEFDWLDTASQKKLVTNLFIITILSDRMGYCFQSEALVKLKDTELLSTAVQFGTVQLLPSGQLICLMADHQTTGGYPRVAQVIQSDLPKLAQRKPNESITFKFISLKEAEDQFMKQHQQLQQIQTSCRLRLNQFLSENYKH